MKPRPNILTYARKKRAFSLLEILVVITIMVVIISISVSVFRGGGQDMTQASNALYDIVQRARTEAMSSNGYVYLGLSPTTGASSDLAIAVVECKDGLASNSNTLDPDNLQPVRQLKVLKGIEINTSEADSGLNNRLMDPSGGQIEAIEDSAISFSSDVVTRRDDIANNNFDWVIQFSPDGAVRLDAEERTVPHYVVLGIVPATGNPANVVGVIIDGPSGAVRIVRPGDAEDRSEP